MAEDSAESVWRDYRNRNNSFVTDTFSWLLKSELRCPECDSVSCKYDPSVSLPLNVPPPPERSVRVVWVPLEGERVVGNVAVDYMSTLRSLRAAVAAKVGWEEDDLFVVPEANFGIRPFGDSTWVYDLPADARLLAFEKLSVTPEYRWTLLRVVAGVRARRLLGLPFTVRIPAHGNALQCLRAETEAHSYAWFDHPQEEDDVGDEEPLPLLGGLDSFEVVKLTRDPTPAYRICFQQHSTRVLAPLSRNLMGKDVPAVVVAVFDQEYADRYYRPDRVTARLLEEEKTEEAIGGGEGSPSGERNSLTACLEDFLQGEELSLSDMWKCKTCKDFRPAKKTISIQSLPAVLMVQLKRFAFVDGRRRKIQTFVRYPLEMDLSRFCAGQSRHVYRLSGVVKHIGENLGNGHYIACSRIGDAWFQFNDDRVTEIKPEAVVSSDAYVLFYEREEDEVEEISFGGSEFEPERKRAREDGEENENDENIKI